MVNRNNTSSFSDQLADAFGKPRLKKFDGFRGNKKGFKPRRDAENIMPPLRQIGEDGKDHINCHGMATTYLGKQLNTEARTHFHHKWAGNFSTLEGFIWYIGTEDDSFRNMPGYIARITGKSLKPNQKVRLSRDTYKILIADAYWQLITAKDKLKNELANSTLPFDMYGITNTGVRIRLHNAGLYTTILELIRQALVNKQEYPDFLGLFAKNSPYGEQTLNSYMVEKGYELDSKWKAYGELIDAAIHKHFSGLVDESMLREANMRQAERQALKAAKEIMKKTENDLKKAAVDRSEATNEVKSEATNEVQAVTNPPKGTLLSDMGRGNDRILTFADGNGGTYEEVVAGDTGAEENDPNNEPSVEAKQDDKAEEPVEQSTIEVVDASGTIGGEQKSEAIQEDLNKTEESAA